MRADVCVIGSGAGGAPLAAALAEGGMRVVMLEEGEPVKPEQVTARPRDMTARLYRDAGQFATRGGAPILLPLGRAVGGTTVATPAPASVPRRGCWRAGPSASGSSRSAQAPSTRTSTASSAICA